MWGVSPCLLPPGLVPSLRDYPSSLPTEAGCKQPALRGSGPRRWLSCLSKAVAGTSELGQRASTLPSPQGAGGGPSSDLQLPSCTGPQSKAWRSPRLSPPDCKSLDQGLNVKTTRGLQLALHGLVSASAAMGTSGLCFSPSPVPG